MKPKCECFIVRAEHANAVTMQVAVGTTLMFYYEMARGNMCGESTEYAVATTLAVMLLDLHKRGIEGTFEALVDRVMAMAKVRADEIDAEYGVRGKVN